MPQQSKRYAVVMRMQGIWPASLAGYERHRRRKGGDMGHVDTLRTRLNRRLIGDEDWAQTAWDEIEDMRAENHARELTQLKKRRRTEELKQRLFRGPRDPWRSTRHGPMREIILTVNKRWFEEDLTEFLGESSPSREQEFEMHAKAWLLHHFGEDCIHARADLDEEAYHIHAVVLPRAMTKDGRKMLQPSIHPMIRNYEAAQDDVGEWFSKLDLCRGVKRKKALREALEHNRKVREAKAAGADNPGTCVELPKHRAHVSPRKWREAQERRLAERDRDLTQAERAVTADRSDLVTKMEDAECMRRDAQAVLAIAQDVAQGRVDVHSNDTEDSSSQTGPAAPPEHRAKRLFGSALAVLRERARKEARADLSSEFEEIKAADEAIIEIAKLLPQSARAQIAKARLALSRPISALHRLVATKEPSPVRRDRNKDRGD